MFSHGIRAGFVVLSGVLAVACAGADGEAGDSGAAGASALVSVAAEPAGVNCATGGQAMRYGVDADGNGDLDASEVDGTSFVCNGSAGARGAEGQAGAAAAKGEKGDTGANGQNGLDGTQGADGVDGQEGARGKDGANGVDGRDGVDGVDGRDGRDGVNVVVLGSFLSRQVVGGLVVECASTTLTETIAECRGMKVNGLDVALAAAEAGRICAGVTGNTYSSANGLGTVPAPYLRLDRTTSAWTLATSGNTSPLQNLSCRR